MYRSIIMTGRGRAAGKLRKALRPKEKLRCTPASSANFPMPVEGI